MNALAPGAAIGILGGGQLGRMLALAGAELGFDIVIYTPEPDSPAGRVAARTIVAGYDDAEALAAFAQETAAITYEFENVPAATAAALIELGALVRPGAASLDAAQDRIAEKRFFAQHAVQTAPYCAIDTEADLEAALSRTGLPAILKTRRLGYDGIGQARVASLEEAKRAFRETLHGAPAIAEGVVAFEREISIIAARGADGMIAFYDLCENQHARGILATTRAPARCERAVTLAAQAAAHTILDALDYIGVLTIEFFLMADGRLIANEMAPRVHNSGHWTIDACACSQFEQHIRAVAGWPLAPTTRFADVEMNNLIGEDSKDWAKWAGDPDARLHLYGKRDVRAGRKMGHVTRVKWRGEIG